MNASQHIPIRVSVIIPAFNVEQWIEQCIESVLAQSYDNLEVIVINDGSSDSTASIIERFAGLDTRIRPFHQQNQGLSAARNKGVELSSGNILVFLDSDDWIYPDTISDTARVFIEYQPDIAMIGCAKYFDGDGTWGSGTDEFYWQYLGVNRLQVRMARETPEILALYPLAPLKVISKDFFIKQGLKFIERLKYEDNPFHISLYCLNPRCVFLPKRYYAWRLGRSDQITASPHVFDCHTVIRKMLATGYGLSSNEFPFLVIALTRLIGSVARAIRTDSERRHFIDTSIRILRENTEVDRLGNALDWIAAATNVHPGDRILTRALFDAPDHFERALGSGVGRYWASLRMLVSASRTGKWTNSIVSFAYLLSNTRLLVNYSRGIGESKVTGLG